MGKSKIDWTDDVLNIVWGCNKNCNKKDHGFDCYAKKFARRIGRSVGKSRGYSDKIIEDMINFKLVLFPDWSDIFDKNCKVKTSRIFLNSMSDICYWKTKWINFLIKKIREYPRHTFLILTKNCRIYEHYTFPLNCFLGVTITDNIDREVYWIMKKFSNKTFVSIEPILKTIRNPDHLEIFDWVIVGADSTPGKQRIIPSLSWIVDIANYCQHYNIPLFMKDSLKKIYGKDLIQEFPE